IREKALPKRRRTGDIALAVAAAVAVIVAVVWIRGSGTPANESRRIATETAPSRAVVSPVVAAPEPAPVETVSVATVAAAPVPPPPPPQLRPARRVAVAPAGGPATAA